ncbi:conserved hypothetical protein [Gammaproteobacteria bacterium]
MKHINFNQWLYVVITFMLTACGGGGGDVATTAQGRLVDSPVEGVEFISGSQSGFTGPNGEFTYEVGQAIQFRLGNLYLGEVKGQSLITPLDLAATAVEPGKTAVNIARLLQSLDQNLSDERITIPKALLENARDAFFQSINILDTAAFEKDAQNILARLARGVKDYKYAVGLLDAEAAARHMATALDKLGISFDSSPFTRPKLPSSLNAFASTQNLEDYLKKGLKQGYRGGGSTSGGSTSSGSDKDGAPVSSSAENNSSGAVSGTNLQEIGVDEADTIKTDGNYLYMATPADGGFAVPNDTTPPLDKPVGKDAGIRILKLSGQPATAIPVSTISLTNHKNAVDGLYLLTGRSDGGSDLLVTVGGNPANVYLEWYNPWYWQNGTTEIGFYDVSDPTAPRFLSVTRLDGQMIATRRIESTLYIVTRYTPAPPSYDPYSGDPSKNEEILAKTPITDLLPKINWNTGKEEILIRPEFCYLPPSNKEDNIQSTLVTVTAMNLLNPDQQVSKSVTGPTDTVYMSHDALYLASTRQYFPPLVMGTTAAMPPVDTLPPETTDIHKFALTANGPEYRGSAEVSGNLGWEADKRSFRMGEYNQVLRVATSLGDGWNTTATTRLSLLREAEDGVIKLVSSIDHIGEAGERLYAARFIGSNGYLVTFRVTDPLYVFDLSDPVNPKIAGELHINGYSDYLHPIGDNLLLGIGKEAVPDTSSPDFSGRGAWYQGVKLALFDVSVGSKPVQRYSMTIGKRGTDSDALMDHHAFAYLPPTTGRQARLALPVRLNDTVPQNDSFNPSDPSAYYDWTHTGLYLFEIDPNAEIAIRAQGRMVVETFNGQNYPYYTGYPDRAVLLGDSAHYLHNGKVWSAPWMEPESALIGPQ